MTIPGGAFHVDDCPSQASALEVLAREWVEGSHAAIRASVVRYGRRAYRVWQVWSWRVTS